MNKTPYNIMTNRKMPQIVSNFLGHVQTMWPLLLSQKILL